MALPYDTIDNELTKVINKLEKIQNEVGGKKKNIILGEDGRSDRFAEIKAQMIERLADIRELMDSIEGQDKASNKTQEVIGTQSKIRSELLEVQEEWHQLDLLYKAESKKRRSKYTPAELAARLQTLTQLQQEIQGIKDFHRAGYVKGYQSKQLTALEDSELFRVEEGNATRGGVASPAVPRQDITDSNRHGLQLIRDKDAAIDDVVLDIGKGVDELRELAIAQRDEVKLQNQMLSSLEEKVDNVHAHITNVNKRMKTTLEKTRKSDKVCVDIFCVLVLIGLLIVLVKLTV